ncbi:MAG TPA: alpha-amylase/4-alpha-glucanotransferase domain-containing protein [Sphaerochaeta sp.]|nr:alpha-amylase/4-alpha-glucanotransferase domain-containing protein [Sphaerochaeta sp.]
MRVLIGAYSQLAHGVPAPAFERVAETVLTPLLTLLHHRQQSTLQLALSMPLYEYLDASQVPLTVLLKDLCRNEKVELLGGTYHQAILSLITPKDRSNQIELMTTALRKRYGQRPKNFFSYGQIFNPSYINALHITCMETVITSVEKGRGSESSGYRAEPYLMQEMGKTVTIVPTSDEVSRAILDFSQNQLSFAALLRLIRTIASRTEPSFLMAMINIDQLVQGGIEAKQTTELFELLFDLGSGATEEVLALEQLLPKGYLSGGWYGHDARRGNLYTLNDLFVRDESLAYLYGRSMTMIESARLYRKDKDVRRHLENLIQRASVGSPYLYGASATMLRPKVRSLIWRTISEVDLILSSLEDFTYLQVADFDRDEVDEHLVISKNLSCVIDHKGGSLDELTYLPSLHNYGDAFALLDDIAVSQSVLHPPHSGEKRRLFTDVLIKSGISLEEYDKRNSRSTIDLGRQPYDLTVLDRRATEFKLSYTTENDAPWAPNVQIHKHIKVRQNTIFLEVALTNLSEEPTAFTYGCEIPLSISTHTVPVAFMEVVGKKRVLYEKTQMIKEGFKSFLIHDEPNATALSLHSDTHFTLLKEDYTIEARSTLQEETIYLHTLFMPTWQLELPSGAEQKIALGFRMERK